MLSLGMKFKDKVGCMYCFQIDKQTEVSELDKTTLHRCSPSLKAFFTVTTNVCYELIF